MQDDSQFRAACGARFDQQPMMNMAAYVPPYDHTAEFDEKDISENKVLAML